MINYSEAKEIIRQGIRDSIDFKELRAKLPGWRKRPLQSLFRERTHLMCKSTKKYIYKLLESAKKIEEITDKENFSSFLSPKAWIIRDAVARRFLIIASVSEILFNKHMEFCMKYPEIPFSAMQGMKRYLTEIQDGDIDWAIVWQTTQEKIPELIKHCDEVISATASLDL